jgi:hypothetical protein
MLAKRNKELKEWEKYMSPFYSGPLAGLNRSMLGEGAFGGCREEDYCEANVMWAMCACDEDNIVVSPVLHRDGN